MSLVTCCPACGTMFKVVPDQLRISEGWVRCGHCSEVFDASAHLQQPTPAAPAGAPALAAAPATASLATAPVAPPAAAAPVAASVVPPTAATSSAPAVPIPPPAPVTAQPVPAPPRAVPAAPAPAAGPPYPPFILLREDDSEIDPLAVPSEPPRRAVARHEVESGWHESWNSSELPPGPTQWPSELQAQAKAAAPAPEEVSFVRQARRRAFWRRGSVRALLTLIALALSALLAAQVAVQQRDRLAATQPALRPLLEALCRPLACAIGPLRRIESIVIDSSSFNRLRPDAYRLSVTLKNQAAMPVALPSLELTLTDTQDQPVLRRVLAPADLGRAVPATLGANADWSTTLALTVTADGSAGRIAGYRLLAFYP